MIRLANHSPHRFAGWIRTTTDTSETIAESGDAGNAIYVLGRWVGRETRIVDVWAELDPGEHMMLHLTRATPFDLQLRPLPRDPIAHFGGHVSVGSYVLDLISIRPDGAAWLLHLRGRLGCPVVANVWLWIYPDEPGFARGEVLLVASDPSSTAIRTATPSTTLRIGDAVVMVTGASMTGQLLPDGEMLADGQGRAFPFVALWTRHCHHTDDLASALAMHTHGIGAVGIKSIGGGGPNFPPGFSARQWATDHWQTAMEGLHRWTPTPLGVLPRSMDPGAQEDQLLHPGTEALCEDGVGAEQVRYLSALRWAMRPCQHLERDGSPLDIDRHSYLRFWDGRPHWHTGVSPDQLGKTEALRPIDSHGWLGPDVQHMYQRGLVAAAALTGSPVCQWLLSRLATVYLLQRTSNPAWSTSQCESAREWGCEAILVQDLYHHLEDRAVADRVVLRWQERVMRILVPQMQSKDLWRVWENEPRLNPTGQGAQWWQESFASYAIDDTCRLVGLEVGRPIALRIARKVMDVAWTQLADGRWRAQAQGPLDGSANDQNPAGDSFNAFGMPGCVATVLAHEPGNQKARAIWNQLLASTDPTARRWMPAGVR